MSGGADFTPESADKSAAMAGTAPVPDESLVTRASSMTTTLRLGAEPATSAEDTEVLQASLNTGPAGGADPSPDMEIDQTARAESEAYLFESLVEGAPTVADILPGSEIAVIVPDGGPDVLAASAAETSGDLRQVAGSRVNMRAGPGTAYGVVTTLRRGADVEVFEVNDQGWARLRNVATGQEGWMAERLLTGG